jgi:phosphoribosylformimino-5-aminoimidazole carboxamide ribotide isomerase
MSISNPVATVKGRAEHSRRAKPTHSDGWAFAALLTEAWGAKSIMRIIPVIDVLGGQVVRAVGGRRSEYRPIRSRLTDSTDPVEVAKVLVAATGADELYFADLNGICGGFWNKGVDQRVIEGVLGATGAWVMADVGWRSPKDGDRFPAHAQIIPVVASETVSCPGAAACIQDAGYKEWAFSIDLRAGELIGKWTDWREDGVNDCRSVASMALAGYNRTRAGRMLVVDLARVGVNGGPAIEECRLVRSVIPAEVRLYVGGGVRDRDDVRRLEAAGADSVLVASALHDGTLF